MTLLNPKTTSALESLRRSIPEAAEALRLNLGPELTAWTQALDLKLLPRLQPDFPLIAAICGGGSAGKSTLFNALVGSPISPTGGRAGLNRRVLAALTERHQRSKAFTDFLAHAFGKSPEVLRDGSQLTTPGDPMVWHGSTAPDNMVLVDTPDIDTGARGEYTNRQQALQSLEAADLFIYIFTNATYNNRDNTDFMAGLLTSVGSRPCFLVYRAYPSFSQEDILDHAQTVARNIYGSEFSDHVLGIFRADEDNEVAAGRKMIQLRSASDPGKDLVKALAGVNAELLRARMLNAIFRASVDRAAQMYNDMTEPMNQLDRYTQLLEKAQGRCVQQALSHFPTDRVLRRFADIWLATDPAHIKVMRRTGRVVEWPYKTVIKAVRGIRNLSGKAERTAQPKIEPPVQLETDLLTAANHLYQWVLEDQARDGDKQIRVPAPVRTVQDGLRQKDWKSVLTYIRSRKEHIMSWSQSLEQELETLSHDLRRRMGLWDQIRQTFSALLNVIPATAAITYVLHTGDPIGAAGIKIKLTGLFGLNDLYALIAIPATAGLKKADQQQLDMLLRPVARTWLAHKLQTVQELFEDQITGELFSTARAARSQAAELLQLIEKAIADCKETAHA